MIAVRNIDTGLYLNRASLHSTLRYQHRRVSRICCDVGTELLVKIHFSVIGILNVPFKHIDFILENLSSIFKNHYPFTFYKADSMGNTCLNDISIV